MNRIMILAVLFGLLIFTTESFGQNDIFGKWECVNDEGRVNSIVEIYKKETGEICGKVVKITKEEDRDKLCTACEGELKNQPIEGLQLMHGLEKDGDAYSGGEIINPKSGKVYKVKIWVDDNSPNTLNVRGYVAFFYKTMLWNRVTSRE